MATKGNCPRCQEKSEKRIVITDVDARMAKWYGGNIYKHICEKCGLIWEEVY